MSHTIPVPPCIRELRTPTVARIASAAASADQAASAIEAEIRRLRLIDEDLGNLPTIASALGALHGALDEIAHELAVPR